MKRMIFIFMLMLAAAAIYSLDKMGSSLIVIEEAENGNISADQSPFSDGIFNALWDKCTSIFFDMKIQNAIPVVSGNLNAEPYIDTAKQNGADSIILIKFNYTSSEKGDNMVIKIDEISYNFYSMNKFEVLKSGKKSMNYNKTIQKRNKDVVLKKIGYDFLSEIYN